MPGIRGKNKTREELINNEHELAWLWISWVRKYSLGLQTIRDIEARSNNLQTKKQALFVLEFFSIQPIRS